MNRILILFLFFTIFNFLGSESSKSSKNKPDLEKIVIWEGEIEAVFKDNGRVRAYVTATESLGKNFTEIKDKILTEKKFSIKQKITNKVIGNFLVLNVEYEKTWLKGKSKEFQITLIGKFDLKRESYNKKISNDFYIAMYTKRESYVDPSAYYNDDPTPPANSIIHEKDRKEMVLIPTGVFLHGQGSDGDGDDFNPAYQNPGYSNVLDIESFYIDKYEVTNREYERYLQETGATPPQYWQDGKIPNGKEDHPVISLSYREVEGYARWVGKRLPTELEWEKSARGQGLKITKSKKEVYTFDIQTIEYPFGNKFNSSLCNSIESGKSDTISVYEIPTKSASKFGVIGMCGNASEWTSSWYEPYQGHDFKSPVKGKMVKVIRGGSFLDTKKQCTVHYRAYGGLPNLSDDRKAGFRLVKDYVQN